MQTIRSGLFVSRAGHILRRDLVYLAGAPNGVAYSVRRCMAGDGYYLVDVGHAAK
jgi:hypothetical protein